MRKTLVLVAAGALAISLAACANSTPTASSSSSPSSDTAGSGPGLNVIASFYPLQWSAEQVVGEHGTVTSLTAPGAEAHDLELTPQQIAALPEADLVLYVEGLQPAVDEAIAASGATALNVADVVDLLPVSEGHSHDHSEEAHDHSEEAHDHGDFDPHFWQDPTLMGKVATALGDRLAELDAAHAADYTAAASASAAALEELDAEFAAGLKSCARSEFITTHAAFNYLATRYGLEEIGISGVNPDGEPSPARIAEVQEEAQLHGITTIFFETLTSDAVAKAIAGDLGLKTAVLDPLEGVTEKSPGTDYPSIMRANLAALVEANECS